MTDLALPRSPARRLPRHRARARSGQLTDRVWSSGLAAHKARSAGRFAGQMPSTTAAPASPTRCEAIREAGEFAGPAPPRLVGWPTFARYRKAPAAAFTDHRAMLSLDAGGHSRSG